MSSGIQELSLCSCSQYLIGLLKPQGHPGVELERHSSASDLPLGIGPSLVRPHPTQPCCEGIQ